MLLKPRHYQEWKDSGVNDIIIERNVRSLDNPDEIDEALNRNTKQRWVHSDFGPGWLVSGICPFTGQPVYDGCEFKPDVSPLNSSGDPQKYISPSRLSQNEQFSKHPLFLDCGDSVDWAWPDVVSDRAMAIGIVEGAKKAGAVMSIDPDLPMISISGVACAQKKGRLHPDIEQFCTCDGVGRTIELYYDSDSHSNRNVARELERLSRLLQNAGAVVKVVRWEEELKGIDDWLAAPSRELIAA